MDSSYEVYDPRSRRTLLWRLKLLLPFETIFLFRMMYYSVMTQAYSEKEIPSSPNSSRTYDLVGSTPVFPSMPVSLLNDTSFSFIHQA